MSLSKSTTVLAVSLAAWSTVPGGWARGGTQEPTAWRVSARPLANIGVVEGDPVYELHGVVDALRLRDGRIVVANGNKLHIYNGVGRFETACGGEGEGPGEFRGLLWLERLPGDSVMAWDWRNLRVSVFSPECAFVRSYSLRRFADADVHPWPVGRFPDGTLLVEIERAFRTDTMPTGATRNSMEYVRYDLESGRRESLGIFPGSDFYTRAWGGGWVSHFPLPFGRYARKVVSGSGFYFGASDSYEYAYYRSDGTLVRTVHHDRPNRAVTHDDLDRYRRKFVNEWSGNGLRARAERLLADMPFPKTMPAYGPFCADALGNLWVAEPYPRGERTHWTVFAPDGAVLAGIDLPTAFEPYEIGTDYVLGKWRDELDVEHVQIYGLHKR